MDVVALRAEIKSWERDFKYKHGRDPQVQDIKDRPGVAEKYKLYKKLSKTRPLASTPSKPQPKSLISKSRAIKTEAPTISNNPFSPVKNREKYKRGKHAEPTRVASNPFATPVKGAKQTSEPSPDPFPLIQSSQIASASQLNLPPPPNSAISRARKRLRGEPVSPSPVKKRQRVTSQISLQLTRSNGTFNSDEDSSEGEITEANSSFVVDSPVKAPVGTKSFMSLFNENPGTRPDKLNDAKRTLSRSNTAAVLFDRARSGFPEEGTNINGSLDTQVNGTVLKKKAPNGKLSLSKGAIPGRDDPWLNDDPSKARKHSLSDTEMEDAPANVPRSQAPSLLPPSPPPVASNRNNNRYDLKGKGKSGANNRKKLKTSVNTNEDEDEVSQEDEKVKIVDWRRGRQKDRETDELWPNDESRLIRRNFSPDEAMAIPNGELIVNVPQDLLDVLAISPTRSARYQEDRVVRALLHGTRVGHYDDKHGGHIFHVGETGGNEEGQAEEWGGADEALEGRWLAGEGEDDEWEGEGVAWETAEL